MKRILPYLFVTLIFGLVLNLSLPTYEYIHTHDEDDNIVSGWMMARNKYVWSRDIFSHHLPGAYIISQYLDLGFHPQSTEMSMVIHRTFVTVWNYGWALVVVAVFGPWSIWLVVVVEMLRTNYLVSLFHAENLVMYPMVYLLLTLLMREKIKPVLSGVVNGLVLVLLSPLWPLCLISALEFIYLNRKSLRKMLIWGAALLLPIILVLMQIEVTAFVKDFFGYNALTYAPMVMKKPLLYTLAAFLAPGMVLFDRSMATKVVMIQLLVVVWLLFGLRKVSLKILIMEALLLGVIGFRNTPRLVNPSLDFHVLPWVVTLATLCWYKFFGTKTKKGWGWVVMLVLPPLFMVRGALDFFPSRDRAGNMVVRYGDNSPMVSYLRSVKKEGDTMLTLPAHTLLYMQTEIKPFNKFLFYLPWMEQSPILYSELMESFQSRLPTYIFIDTIHFPYTPPKEIREVLPAYRAVRVVESEPPVYILN